MEKALRIGEQLMGAGLISEAQLQVVLRDQGLNGSLYRLGEILVLRGWLKQETLDFFIDNCINSGEDSSELRLGDYLVSAKLLTRDQVDQLLREQHSSGIRLGSMAVLYGWLNQKTLNFMLHQFFPDKVQEPDFQMDHMNVSSYTTINNKTTIQNAVYRQLGELDVDDDDLDEFIEEFNMSGTNLNPNFSEDDPWVFG